MTQRDRKFRAWDSSRKRWRVGVSLDESGDQYTWQKVSEEDGDASYAMVQLSRNFLTISFSTGLKDKNGVEIYEGDIVRLRFHEAPDGESYEIGQIIWNENSAGFKWAEGHPSDMYNYWLTHADTDWREVIGNIYENPELLEATATDSLKSDTDSTNTTATSKLAQSSSEEDV